MKSVQLSLKHRFPSLSYPALTLSVFSLSLLFVAGCGGGPGFELIPVKGKVTVDGQPLSGGIVYFIPADDNDVKANPKSKVKSDGTYELSTDGKAGAPPGQYKVTVVTQGPGLNLNSDVKVDQKYSSSQTTPLSVEVVDEPSSGAYDLEVTEAEQ